MWIVWQTTNQLLDENFRGKSHILGVRRGFLSKDEILPYMHQVAGTDEIEIRARQIIDDRRSPTLSHYESDRDVTYHLFQTDDEWVCCEAKTGKSRTKVSIHSHGTSLNLTMVDLDENLIAEEIRTDALTAFKFYDQKEGTDPYPCGVLAAEASELASRLHKEWTLRGAEVIRNACVRRGFDGTMLWAGSDDLCLTEVEAVIQDLDESVSGNGIDQNILDKIRSILQSALIVGINEIQTQSQPYFEYGGRFQLKT